jgi:hypothetical protein
VRTYLTDSRVVEIYINSNRCTELFEFVEQDSKPNKLWQDMFQTIKKSFDIWPKWVKIKKKERFVEGEAWGRSKDELNPQHTVCNSYKIWAEQMKNMKKAPSQEVIAMLLDWIELLPKSNGEFQLAGCMDGREYHYVKFNVSSVMVELLRNPSLDKQSISRIISALPKTDYIYLRLLICAHQNTPEETLRKHYESSELTEEEAKNLLYNPNLPTPGVHYSINRLTSEPDILSALSHRNIGTLTLRDFAKHSNPQISEKAQALLDAARLTSQ